ncbi:MAG: lipopolysaccharide heptosyltransferase II [bacterium]
MDMRNIMVRSPNWIGDFVLSVPAIRALQSRFPRAKLTVVAHKRVSDLALMVEGVESVVEYDGGALGRGIGRLMGFSQRISSEPIDLSVIFPLSFSSALMSYFSGARRRLGYSTEMRGFLLTDRVALPSNYRANHLSESYSNLLGEIGVEGRSDEPQLSIPRSCEKAERILRKAGLNKDKMIVGMAPYAAYGPAKRWPIENFLHLAMNLLKKYDCRVMLFGSEEDAGPYRESPVRSDGILNLCGKLDLRASAYMLKRCACLISNDTGIAHVAAAVGTPVVSIFGSTSPSWTSPIGKRNVVVYERVDCSPCFDRECRFCDYRCLHSVTTDAVFEAVQEVLE